MPRAVDRKTLAISHDPNYMPEFSLHEAMQQGVDMWKVLLESIKEHIESMLRETIQRILGVSIDPGQAISDLWDQLTDWLPDMPDLGELYAQLTGIVGATAADMQQWATGIRNALSGINLTEPGGILALLAAILNLPTGQTLSVQNVVNIGIQRIFGMVDPRRLGVIPASHIGADNPEMLVNPGFTSSVAILANTDWSYDDTLGRTEPWGTAHTTGDGNLKELLSEPIAVSADHKIDFVTWWRWRDLAYTGGISPLVMGVAEFLRDASGGVALVAKHDLASVTSPAADSSNTGEEDFVQLTAGTYTVPSNGVNEVCMYLHVRDNATAGDVWVDDASARKPGVISQNLVSGLVGALSGLNAQVTNVLAELADKLGLDALADLINAIGGGVGSTLADIEARLANISVNGLINAEFLTNVANIPAIAKDRITGLLDDLADKLNISEWDDWLSTQWNAIVADVADKLNVSEWDDWLSDQWQSLLDGAKGAAGGAVSDILNRIQKLRTDGKLLAADLEGLLAQSQVTGLVQLISDLLHNPAAVIGTLTQSMVSGLTSSLANLNSAISQIGDIFDGLAVTPISSAIQNVVNWFQSFLGFKTTTVEDTVAVNSAQISQMNAASYRNQAYVSRWPVADLSYPESYHRRLDSYTGAGATANSNGYSETTPLQMPANAAIGSYIQTLDDVVYDTVVCALRHGGTAPNNCSVEIFSVSPGRTAAERIFTAPISGLSPDVGIFEIPITGGLAASRGDTWLVRIRNSTTNSQTLGFARMRLNLVAFTWQSFVTTDATSTAKTAYTAAELAAGTDVSVPWVGLVMKNGTYSDQTYADLFDLPVNGALGPLYSTPDTRLAVSGNAARYNGGSNGNQSAVYSRALASDRMESAITIEGTGSAITGARSGTFICANRDMSQMVYLGVNLNSAKIYSGSKSSLVERATLGTGGDGRWIIRYNPATNTYTALKDGDEVMSWVDSGSVVQHGWNYRLGGLRISRDTLVNAAPLRRWVLRDWTPA